MVYNARERELVNNDALTLREGLPDKTWYRFERYNVIYLGAPSQMDVGPQSFLSENSEPAAMGDPAGRGGWPSAH
jgi:hypothetical protein